MVKIDRSIPYWTAATKPRDCGNCSLAAFLLAARGRVSFEKKGYFPFPAFHPITEGTYDPDKRYLKKTVVEVFSGIITGFYEYETSTYSGSRTRIYQRDPRTGFETLISDNGSAVSSIGTEDGPIEGSATIVDGVVTYSEDFWGRIEAHYADEDGPDEISDGPDSVSQTVLTSSYSGPDFSSSVGLMLDESYSATLSEENTDEAVEGLRMALLDAIPLGDLDPLSEVGLKARYGPEPGENYGTLLTAAEAAYTSATTAVTTADGMVSASAAALASAIATSASKKTLAETARGEWGAALQAWEGAQIAVETWTRRGDAVQLSAAEAALESLAGDLADAEVANSVARTEWESAVSAVINARSDYHFKVYHYKAKADAALINAGVLRDIAQANKDAMDAGGDELAVRIFVQAESVTHPYAHRNGTELERVRYILASPFEWSVNPDSARIQWRQASVAVTAGVVDSAVEFEPLEQTFDSLVGQSYVRTNPRVIDPPDIDGRIYVVGLPVRAKVSVGIQTTGGASRKYGFPQYTPAAVPKIYARETASGGFPGCVLEGRPAKVYSGSQFFEAYEGSPGAGLTIAFSADVPLEKRSIMPGFDEQTGEPNPVEREFLNKGEILSPTSRRWRQESSCGENPIVDELSLALTEEATTAALKAQVDVIADLGWDELADEPGLELVGDCAIQYLSPSEIYYAKQKMRISIGLDFPAAFTDIWNPTDSFDVEWIKQITDLTTGERENVSETRTLESPSYELVSPLEIAPEDGKIITIGQFVGPTDPRFWDSIKLVPHYG